jgi:hypothetical protein
VNRPPVSVEMFPILTDVDVRPVWSWKAAAGMGARDPSEDAAPAGVGTAASVIVARTTVPANAAFITVASDAVRPCSTCRRARNVPIR